MFFVQLRIAPQNTQNPKFYLLEFLLFKFKNEPK